MVVKTGLWWYNGYELIRIGLLNPDLKQIISKYGDEMNFKDLLALFTTDEYISHSPLGCGHINSTFKVELRGAEGVYSIVLQKINTSIFPDVDGLMNNIVGVTEYLRERLPEGEDPMRAVMKVIPALDGKNYAEFGGDIWRVYVYVTDTTTYQQIEKPEDFYNCGLAFGDFQERLANYPTDKLCETIKNFHHTVSRFETFKKAVAEDVCGRAKEVQAEIDFALNRESLAHSIVDQLENGEIPYRVTHNDTKLNNILFDNFTGKTLCVIDLDTIMPGAACYDFGDCIRFGASSAPEDEKDLSKVYMNIDLFREFAKGYLEVAAKFLTEKELPTLSLGSAVMTFECGIRFLTDYLQGDTYFKTSYEGQNLDRCRTQFKLVADMEEKMDEMQKIVEEYAK